MLKGNKKRSLQDMIFIAVVLLFFGLVTLIAFKISSEFNSNIQSNVDIPTEAKTASADLTSMYPGVMDNIFLFLVVGLTIVSLVFAALVKVHPIFVPLFIIGWIILIFMCGVLSNIYTEMAGNSILATEANQLTFITSILGTLPFVIAIIGIILMVVLHKLGNIAE